MAVLREGAVLANRFRLIRPLAHGGMGAVWVGEHTLLHVPVAIKLMGENVRDHPSLQARFEREALAAAQLKSPHIVAVQDFGFEDDVPFMVMELLEGEDLARCLQRRGPLPPEEALEIAIPIAKALTKAHHARVVHRDLKPANIFLARIDGEEVVKVLDFGIAKLVPTDGSPPEDPTSTNSLIGSPTYMSPEQVRTSREVDARADLWALAVILFRMLTGKVPFEGDSPGDLLVKICTEAPRRISHLAPALAPSLDAFFERALQKDPALRFQSAHELVNAFATTIGRAAPFGSARTSLPALAPVEPTPVASTPLEQPQTLASTNFMPRRPNGLPMSTLALAAAPVAALAGIVLLAIWRGPSDRKDAGRETATQPVAMAEAPARSGALEPEALPAPIAETATSLPASSSPPSEPSSELPEPRSSASAVAVKGRLPQPSAKPAVKDRIKFGL